MRTSLITCAAIALLAARPAEVRAQAPAQARPDAHAAVLAESQYPSASKCASCHQAIYDEWSSSSHANASISPVFHKFEQRINDLRQF